MWKQPAEAEPRIAATEERRGAFAQFQTVSGFWTKDCHGYVPYLVISRSSTAIEYR
jgi:hypothetical protein